MGGTAAMLSASTRSGRMSGDGELEADGVAVDAEGADQAGRAVMDVIVEGADPRRWPLTVGAPPARRSPMTT
jgi:hypothetical protein